MSLRAYSFWSLALVYMLGTYLSLGELPDIWNGFNQWLGGKGILVISAGYSGAALYIMTLLFHRRKLLKAADWLLLLDMVLIFFLMVSLENYPGEKIHMAQYGVLGVILFNALRHSGDFCNKNFLILGGLICIFAGTLDETIQGILPNRTFTWHDVFINGGSGVMTLLFLKEIYLKGERKEI